MLYQLSIATCVSIALSACGAIDVTEEPVATAESLQTLRQPTLSRTSPAVRASITQAGLRLCDLQADRFADNAHNGLVDEDPDDGGWDWQTTPGSSSHSGSASSKNLYGATGLGLWGALQTGAPRPRYRAALVDTYQGIRQDAEVASAPDFVLLVLMSERYSDGRYAELARERYDSRIAEAGDANLLAASIRDSRHAAGADGLIAYDLAWFGLGAWSLSQAYPGAGYHADFERYMATVIEDLRADTPSFDYRDAHEGYYVTGLAWSMLVSSWSPRNRSVFGELRSRLLGMQLENGAWPYSADFPDANVQATAHALIALGLTKQGHAAQAGGKQGVDWLVSQQNDNGGWSYGADLEYPLIDAEVALGMYLVGSVNSDSVSIDVARGAPAPSVSPSPPAPFVLPSTPAPTPAAPEAAH
jgi:hypothetical protein